MKRFFIFLPALWVSILHAEQKIPESLKGWEDWATWDHPTFRCPTAFDSPEKIFCFCPSELSLQMGAKEGLFSIGVNVYHESWCPLPGDSDLWPLNVRADGKPIAVVEHSDRPMVFLPAGTHHLAGNYRWLEIPQKIRVPAEYGMVSLTVEGKALPFPNWDSEGFMWLKQNRTEEGDKDFITVQVYRMIRDGIPMWLDTILELSVSGKSREVELGNILPEGWSMSSVESPIPVAVDEQGMVKAQVRAGKWFIEMSAFRTRHSPTFKLKDGTTAVTDRELIGFQADPEFRMLDIRNAPPVDVTQTTYPEKWRQWPVYQWNVKTLLTLEEKMRGSGLQSPKSMRGSRELWLNEKGRGYTYHDHLTGEMQDIWRLDVPRSLQLGSVKVNGQGQLITRNPQTGDSGVEIRSRNLQLEAMGISARVRAIPATGWNADLDSLNLTLNLPPGWRMLALFGAESVEGDWLRSWTLLDLFLLLIFSLAVYRLWGMGAGIVAFLAFALTYHEPGSPHYSWLVLLAPLALSRVVVTGNLQKVVTVWKYAALIYLLLVIIPFTYGQIQSVIYPQLEVGNFDQNITTLGNHREQIEKNVQSQEEGMPLATLASGSVAISQTAGRRGKLLSLKMGGQTQQLDESKTAYFQQANMAYEAKARIQTGPGIPDWHWRTVICRWNGPVTSKERLLPILIPPALRKFLTLAGLGFIFWLIVRLLGFRKSDFPIQGKRSSGTFLAFLCLLTISNRVSAQQIPDKETLETLKNRLLKPSDAYPRCAEIPSVNLRLGEDRISYDAQIDAAIQTAVPLPGRFPGWSPVKVQIDGHPESPLQRQDGFLWIVVPEGVHYVLVEGLLPGTREWEWSFLLKPRTVVIEAPGWIVTGLRPDGTPEQQIFFARKQMGGGEKNSAYNQREFNVIAVVDRELEIGLTWQIHTKVTRLSAPGKAISLQIPLLAGEQVLSPGITPKEGNVEVRLAANEEFFAWESEMSVVGEIKLAAPKTDRWVERWHLVSSPVWNVQMTGLKPLIESSEENLVPVWHPWPGEMAALTITRPETVSGPTMTIHSVRREIDLGNRNRNSNLKLALQCSVGDDLVIGLDPSAEVTSVKRGEIKIPVRRDGGKLIVPVQPGMQALEIDWKEAKSLGFHASLAQLELPVESSNITTLLRPPANRWILWTYGPLRGPAVRFWGVLACGLLVAWVLGGLQTSPLNRKQWSLLMVGLTQVSLISSILVVGWLFLLAWRGREEMTLAKPLRFNVRQLLIIASTLASLGIFLAVVYKGLLGNPRMFILGNGSSPSSLNWYAPTSHGLIPNPGFFSLSIWFYKILMLLWALWLANSLVRWLSWGWKQFTAGGYWRSSPKPPPIPHQP